MKKILLLFIFLTTAIPFKVVAGSNDSALKTKVTQWMSNANGIRFLENKGQMMDMQRKAANNVLFEADASGMNVYVTTDGLSYVFTKMDKHEKASSSGMPDKFVRHHENDSVTVQYCRADMQLVGAHIRKENIIKEGESTDRTDYYYGDICPDGILNVHSYGKVTIKNIYPGIDWVLHGGKRGLKYDFIVHPGADPSLIRLKYKWTDKPQLQDDGSVKISTPMGNITEGTPASYCNGEQVQTTYTVKDNEIHFKVSNYNSTQTLTIDPILVWATYYGGETTEYDDVLSMQDDGTNVWITGITLSSNFPTFNSGGGAYFQGNLLGAQGNLFILQFTTNGVLKWATYYGGNVNCKSVTYIQIMVMHWVDMQESQQQKQITEHKELVLTLPQNTAPRPEDSILAIIGKPTFKPELVSEIFIVLKDFFSLEQQSELEKILKTGSNVSTPLLFKDSGNRLADAFKQLKKADMIIGCQKKELESWIAKNFKFLYRNEVKQFKLRYLNDIISTDKDKCQNPILNVTLDKTKGSYIIGRA